MKIGIDDATQSCTLRIQAVIDRLKPAERRAAAYILQHPQDALSLTINELAEKSGSSYATINRLIAHIGFSGIKELKKNLYQDVISNNTLDFLDVLTFSQGTSAEEVCKNIFDLSSTVLSESRKIVNAQAIDAAASRIIAARSLCFIGTGLSGISARYAYSRFFRIGIPCYNDEDSTLYKMKTSLLTKGDLLFAISSSGRSANILDCVKIAKNNLVDIISLSDYAISPLSQLSDISLFTTPRNASQFMNIDMPLLIGQIYIIDALYMCCCVKMGKRSSEIYIKTKESTDSEKVSE